MPWSHAAAHRFGITTNVLALPYDDHASSGAEFHDIGPGRHDGLADPALLGLATPTTLPAMQGWVVVAEPEMPPCFGAARLAA